MVVIQDDPRHSQANKKREAYNFLVKDGMKYQELEETLGITRQFLTQMALDTNLIPTVSTNGRKFNRNLLYHCIKERETVLKEIDDRKKRRQKEKADREKYTCNDDWSVQ